MTDLLTRHPLPWALNLPSGKMADVDKNIIMDANGQEVLGASEWLVCENDTLEFIVESVNMRGSK